ncbi:MAG: 16S rRNA (uracil(1498)-N(3))-methyltransferase [Burkholderiales bacterium]
MQNPSMPEKTARVARFFVDAPLAVGDELILPDEAAHHAVHVLRLRAGGDIMLFNGRGGEFAGRIAAAERRRVRVALLEYRGIERESPLAVTLVQGVSAGEKMDFTVQKATELGVAALQPVIAARSLGRLAGERAAARRAHWQRVVIAACEQCGRNRVPAVHPVVPLAEHCRQDARARSRLLLSPLAARGLRAARIEAPVTLAAGPEAGFTADEEAMLIAAGYEPVRLGPRVLRTETAALAALAALNALAGDF